MSAKKQSTNGNSGNPLLEALLELLEKIETNRAKVPKAVSEAAKNLREELPGVGSSEGAVGKREAWDEGLRPPRDQSGERHDKKRPPAGFVFEHGALVSTTPFIIGGGVKPPQTRGDELLALNVIKAVQLWAQRRTLAKPQQRAALESAYQAIHGHPYGEQWRDSLASIIHKQWLMREEARLRKADLVGRARQAGRAKQRCEQPTREPPSPMADLLRDLDERIGDPGPMFRPANGAEVLEWLRGGWTKYAATEAGQSARNADRQAIPADLSADVISEMLSRVGGRGGKKARNIVDEWADQRRKARRR